MHHLYLINDESQPKTFQFVWTTLMVDLNISPIQAEQCCLIAKENGKCLIKQGDIIELSNIKEKMESKGLSLKLIPETESLEN